MSGNDIATSCGIDEHDELGIDWKLVGRRIWERKALVLLMTVFGGGIAVGVALVVPSTYVARTVILPPQQQQGGAAAALGSLGSLASLAPGLTGTKSSAEQYMALLGSATLTDRVIDQFNLLTIYDKEYRSDVRKKLVSRTVLSGGKRDGLITIEVQDREPQRAADMANAYVDGLRSLTNTLAVTEAQQRRMFFEQKLQETQANLIRAQVALQSSGVSSSAIKTEPRAAVEGYAKLRAELTAAEVKYQSMRYILADQAPELAQQQAVLLALRSELTKLEARHDDGDGKDAGYVGRVREFKYQETLFEMYARQFELARADESREGGLIQVVDVAMPPDKKDWPKPLWFLVGGAVASFLLVCFGVQWGRRAGSVGSF